jgi:hypothetical protein
MALGHHAAVLTIALRSPDRVNLAAQREPVTILSESEPVTFRATAVLPYDNLDRATAGLRGRLRMVITDHDADLSPDWATLVVTGPTMTKDARGNTWFECTATVQARMSRSDATIAK